MRDWSNFIGLPLWFWLFVLPTILVVLSGIYRERALKFLTPIWHRLDRLYTFFGALAAAFMCLILLLIIGQMVARWSNVAFQGSTEFAGYAMAATSFFAFAYALNNGAHIRVSILLNINDFTRRWVDVWALFIASIIATYFARYAIKTNFLSEMLNDRTQGQDQVPDWLLSAVSMFGTWPWNWGELWANTTNEWVFTPVWLPQIPMSIGTVLLAIALWDNLIRLVVTGHSHIVSEAVA
jgi:TRAP-type C4-dicarboxylate transport system permease small subunit